MIEILPESTSDTISLRASGLLTDADYKTVLIPALDAMLARHGKLNALILLDGLLRMEPAAVWDDARYGMTHRADVGRIALVGGADWMAWAIRLWAMVSPGEFRAFPAGEAEAARRWIGLPSATA
ncbi:MAG TPA: STAS/SEC14 domain-containing protein [Rhodoblastus sp.]|nr:STAS/SEC14 domain-containing protein [Rhodoblastus sp.]